MDMGFIIKNALHQIYIVKETRLHKTQFLNSLSLKRKWFINGNNICNINSIPCYHSDLGALALIGVDGAPYKD